MKSGSEAVLIRHLVDQCPALAAIHDPVWEQCLQVGSLIHAADGEVFNLCSSDIDAVAILLQGAMKVRARAADGREFSVYRVHSGQVCMLSLAFSYARERLYAEMVAEGPVSILRVPRADFEQLLAHSPSFRNYLLPVLSAYVMNLLGSITASHFDGLETRVMAHIHELQQRTGMATFHVTHAQLAAELGSSREVISRLLKTLERSGRLRMGRKSITLCADDPAPAAARAKGKTSPGSAPSKPAAR
jgi:CRP/FNR family transcriptional regulator